MKNYQEKTQVKLLFDDGKGKVTEVGILTLGSKDIFVFKDNHGNKYINVAITRNKIKCTPPREDIGYSIDYNATSAVHPTLKYADGEKPPICQGDLVRNSKPDMQEHGEGEIIYNGAWVIKYEDGWFLKLSQYPGYLTKTGSIFEEE